MNGKAPARRVASASAYTPQDRSIKDIKLPGVEKSNEALWKVYHTSPEVHFIVQSVMKAISRVKFVPTLKNGRTLYDSSGDPRIDKDLADAALGILDRLKGPMGGQSQLIGSLAACLALAADGWLIGYKGDTTTGQPSPGGEEMWATVSRDRIRTVGGIVKLKIDDGEYIPVEGNFKIIRFWFPAADRPTAADSWVTPLIRTIELLRESYEALGAVTLSQINAGIIIVPSEQDLPQLQSQPQIELQTDPQTGESIRQDFAQTLADQIADFVESAANTMNGSYRISPIVVPVDSDMRNLEWIPIGRTIDPQLATTIEALRYQIAVGCPYPTETLLGQNQSKFYQGVQNVERLDQETFRHIYDPMCELIADGLKRYVLFSYLEEMGFTPKEYEQLDIGWDNSQIVSPTDNCEKAIKLYSLSPPGITLEELREDCGYDAEPEGSFPEQTPTPDVAPDPKVTPVAQASAAKITKSYSRVSQEYIEKLGLICDQTITRMQERAGNRLRSLANKPDLKPIRETMHSVDPENVGQLPGIEKFAQNNGETDESLFGEVLNKLEPQYVRLTRATISERNAIIKQNTGEELEETDDSPLITAGWLVLSAGILALAKKRFFTGTIEEVAAPEKPAAHTIPTSLLRSVASSVGGAQPEQADMFSIATGPRTLEAYTRSGYSQTGWSWNYGDPATRINPFEPHEEVNHSLSALDLTGFGGLYPGDHPYCQCILEPIFE
jgi:hypothetical protein